jgi:hypothetical protein
MGKAVENGVRGDDVEEDEEGDSPDEYPEEQQLVIEEGDDVIAVSVV